MNLFTDTVTAPMWIVLGLVIFTTLMFVWERLRPDVTALLVLVLLGLTGLVPSDQLFDGFAGTAVMSVIATMVLGAGLDRAGVTHRLANFLLRAAAGRDERLVMMTAASAGLLSGVVQNPSVSALYLPLSSRLTARTGVSLSRLLYPMAACVVMGGGLTLVGSSPLILLNDLLLAANANLPPGAASIEALPILAPLPIGLALLIAGLAYFRLLGRRFFEAEPGQVAVPGSTESYFARTYGIDGDVYELTVTSESPLVGMSVGEAERQRGAPLLLALKSGSTARLAPPGDKMIWVGSVLGVLGERGDIQDYAQRNLLRVSSRLRSFSDLFNPSRAGISEAVIPPTSRFIGLDLAELKLRAKLGINVLAINRSGEVFREDARGMDIRAGDMLVFHSIWRDLANASENRDFVVVTDYPKEEQRPHKLWWAVMIFLGALGLALTSQVPVPVALMTGVVAMLLAGVLKMDEAYAAINWKTVFLMACLIPLGWAVDSTGAAALVATVVTEQVADWPPFVVHAILALLTTLLGLAISNVGAAVIMVPIAINIALSQGLDPVPGALVIAFAASNNLISPSNPVLAMVAGPGGYSTRDLMRAGLPLSVAYLAIVIAAVELIRLAGFDF